MQAVASVLFWSISKAAIHFFCLVFEFMVASISRAPLLHKAKPLDTVLLFSFCHLPHAG
jgi:hypothetical protein